MSEWTLCWGEAWVYNLYKQGDQEKSWEKIGGNLHTFKIPRLPLAIRLDHIRRRCKSSNWILFVRKSVFCTNLQNPINDWWNISLFRLPWIPSGCRDGRLWRVYTLSIPPVPKVQAPISPLAHCEFLCNFHFNIISQAVLWCQNPLGQIEINIEIGLYLLTFSWLAVSLFLDLPLKKKKKDSRTEQTKTLADASFYLPW